MHSISYPNITVCPIIDIHLKWKILLFLYTNMISPLSTHYNVVSLMNHVQSQLYPMIFQYIPCIYIICYDIPIVYPLYLDQKCPKNAPCFIPFPVRSEAHVIRHQHNGLRLRLVQCICCAEVFQGLTWKNPASIMAINFGENESIVIPKKIQKDEIQVKSAILLKLSWINFLSLGVTNYTICV